MSSSLATKAAWWRAARRGSLAWRTRKVLRRPQFWFGLIVLTLIIAWYAYFSFGPVFRGLYLAFMYHDFVNPEQTHFVGFDNFVTVSQHFLFPIAIKNTIVYALLLWGMTFPLALLTSLSLVSITRGRRFFQFTIFIPVVVSLVAIALLFKQLLDPDTGMVNAGLRALGLPEGKFLTDAKSAMYTVAAIDSWKVLGSYMVLLTAGLLNIPMELYDAAKVDGANSWQMFWKITIPLLTHILVLVMTMLLIMGLQMFVSGTLLPRTPGGPGYATTVLSIWLYSEAFTNWRFGIASTISVVLFAVVFIITFIQMRIRPSWEY